MSQPDKRRCPLAQKTCIPCNHGVPPLKGPALTDLLAELQSQWSIVEEHHLQRGFKFKDFRQALDFTNRIGQLAETQNHHPQIELGWGKVKVTIFTHKIGGLTESDFVLAAKIDEFDQAC